MKKIPADLRADKSQHLGSRIADIDHAQGVITLEPSPRQLQHETKWGPGGPCRRCGLRYSRKTAYVACFVDGDTRETWLARQPEELQAEIKASPSCLDCGHPLTPADMQADVCPYCGVA